MADSSNQVIAQVVGNSGVAGPLDLPVRQESSLYLRPVADKQIKAQPTGVTHTLTKGDFNQTRVSCGGSSTFTPTNQDTLDEVGTQGYQTPSLITATNLLTDYIVVQLQSRGDGDDPGPLTYKFLINPNSVNVSRQTQDTEAFGRAGYLTGISNELIDVTLSGQTAGTYFAKNLVDGYREYSASYRSLQELQSVFENNGCWFEGETVNNDPRPCKGLRQQIRLQGDVILRFGNFIWRGAFTDLTVEQDAYHPYYSKFNLGFMVFKERFREDSSWRNSLETLRGVDGYRGHALETTQRLHTATRVAEVDRKTKAYDPKIGGIYAQGPDPLLLSSSQMMTMSPPFKPLGSPKP